MWAAMRAAEQGWAYLDEDASVRELERLTCTLLGKEAALLLPTGSASNLVGVLALGEPGTEVLLDSTCHVATSEARGFETVAGLVERPLAAPAGCPDPAAIDAAAAEGRRTGRRASLLCLETSHNNAGGVAVSAERLTAAGDAARRHGARVHLDGARLLNAAIALGVPAARLTECADTVALSLGKGLCAPGGSMLAGSRSWIERAREGARRIGAGSLHKAGITAAAAIVALKSMVDRLADDNRRARTLGVALAKLPGLRIDLATVQTNIVVIDVVPPLDADTVLARLATHGVLGFRRSATRFRFVTHRTIGDEEIERAITAVAVSL
jgi:threonine aldolase